MSVCLHLYLGNMYVQSLLRQEVGMEFPEMELQMVLSWSLVLWKSIQYS